VFYDYDEIAPMSEITFRSIPAVSFGKNDVYPEQFERLLVTEPAARQIFYEYHRDLLDPEFWRAKQALVSAGEQEDVFPYPEEQRFARSR
jgi:isocitrate dehydrogenase kinase/phosphatase